ncbi:hypothetical protein EXIGLDRAFT_654270 [Exidia glandulosa HHB12029]|uniref:GST N-terminal domain-containing protein n=1 Tax=Exidia glandulosa HHB12029 TaxID=1314781 RepID=A0A165ZRG2_EXIGL|nr:hypothetical protein EXIGLDRAFT_654270 [Exidia glandulosa HHB12029]
MSSSASQIQPLTFYDIASKDGVGPWSLNTWKARFALNYKGIPYKTIFLSYPDIEPEMRKIGAAPGIQVPGFTLYTCPVIVDPNHSNVVISDSFKIAVHLDDKYPDTPRVLPPGTRALQKAFVQLHFETIFRPVAEIVCPACPENLESPRAREYFERTRLKWFGKPLEEWIPSADRAAHWKKLEEAHAKIGALYDQAKEEFGVEDTFMMGTEPSFADFLVAGGMLWIKKFMREPGDGWDIVRTWEDGRWEKLLTRLEPYMDEH